MNDDEKNTLMHYGILRKSGRYPWGSAGNVAQRSKDFLDYVDSMKLKGLTETEIAQGIGMPTSELRAARSMIKARQRAADISTAQRLKEKAMSNVAIGQQMGRPESSVRALLNPSLKESNDILLSTTNMLKERLSTGEYLDVGVGNEHHIGELGISEQKFKTAIAAMKDEGYKVFYVEVEQVGNPGKFTNTRVLAPESVSYPELMKNLDNVKPIANFSENGGRDFVKIAPPKNVDSKRVGVRYADEGGADKDGVIELRRGVEDISLGGSKYAQVRIAVDGTHYLKGMAMYSDDMPDGVDMVFNTNKKSTGDKLDAMKAMKDDADAPFGSIVRQKTYLDKNGKEQQSVLNIVGSKETSGEEGGWLQWSKTLSSQMLSKQSPQLAKEQLDETYKAKKAEYDEIMELTNPTVRKKLLESFADGADSSAMHLKAAGLPRTANHVILPINSLKDDEIYAPQYRDGETVVLIRHPHGGKFEIPQLKVNNRNKEANGVIKQAADAVGINSKVAARLSGADFDGDTVLVIPNNNKKVSVSAPLNGLKDFDPQSAYPAVPGMKTMTNKQRQMGDVSNLITDMTIMGANQNEIAAAVRHSMVVIDAEKHNLNYKQSAIDNGIAGLKEKYQGKKDGGASTIISRSKSDVRVDARKPRSAKDGGPVNAKTGEKMWEVTGESYTKETVSKRTGEVKTQVITKQTKTKAMLETRDAHSLVSKDGGTPMERVYADHANRLKALANNSRKAAVNTKAIERSPSAAKTYANEVNTLKAKLNVALKNAPLERQAQLIATTVVSTKKAANPSLEKEDIKKLKTMALTEARIRTGAKKNPVNITPAEWNAIQAGAISNNVLTKILNNTDLDHVKQLATPRENRVMSDAKMTRAKNMLAAGKTQAEIADALGVPTSTLNSALGR